jgi:polysaccharide export outer membrane protein
MGIRSGAAAALAAAALLGGCGELPRGAAVQSEVLRNRDSETADFAVHEVTREFLPVVAAWPAAGHAKSYGWLPREGGAVGSAILPGDTIRIAIWDADENSLLTAPQQKSTTLHDVTVSPRGDIFVPYVGAVRVAGMTEDAARERVQEALAAISQSAQVQLSAEAGARHSVHLLSGVGRPGPYPLAERDMTVLDALSLGGGPLPQFVNPQLRLQRGDRTYGISLRRLMEAPELDTVLRPGDRIFVEEDSRSFLALGAAGKEETIVFPKDQVTALDAMTLIGGLSETRANPKGILILREYPLSAVRLDGAGGPTRDRVVFIIDLTSADGLFSAGRFRIEPQDLVLVSESPVSSALVALSLLGNVLGIGSRLSN